MSPEPAPPDDNAVQSRRLTTEQPASAPGPRDDTAAAASHRPIPSTDLFRGAVELQILHRDQIYRLRQTALGKLILTK